MSSSTPINQRRLRVNVIFTSASTTYFGQIISVVSLPQFFLCSGEIASASLFQSSHPQPFLKSSFSYLFNLLFSSSAPVKLQRRLFFLFYSHLLLLPMSSIRIAVFLSLFFFFFLQSPPPIQDSQQILFPWNQNPTLIIISALPNPPPKSRGRDGGEEEGGDGGDRVQVHRGYQRRDH